MSLFGLFKGKPKPQPIVIETEIGTFTLKNPQKDTLFEGEINWLGTYAGVSLEPDSRGAYTADKAISHLKKITENIPRWDERIKRYAAEDMSDDEGMIEIWGSGEDEEDEDEDEEIGAVTKEEFISRISIGFIHIYSDGRLFFDYDLDDMFTDHGLGIDANISGEILSASIWG